MSYHIYDDSHDEVIHARDLIGQMTEPEQRALIRNYRDDLMRDLAPEAPRGETDGTRRASVEAARLALREALADLPRDVPMVFLLDNSGSMRGEPIRLLVNALEIAGDEMDRVGHPFEVLGFTTRTWKGGEPRRSWIAERNRLYEEDKTKRLPEPGRLCELRHVVFKDLHEPWDRACLDLMLVDGYCKENVDGEALAWASDRITERGGPAALGFVTDGAPVDDSTLTFNPRDFLKDHALDEHVLLRQHPLIRLGTLNLHETPSIYPDAVLPEGPFLGWSPKGQAAVLLALTEVVRTTLDPRAPLVLPEPVAF